MRVDLLTREYPPEIYGGAGVHVAELVRALRETETDVRVRAFGKPRKEVWIAGWSIVSVAGSHRWSARQHFPTAVSPAITARTGSLDDMMSDLRMRAIHAASSSDIRRNAGF